MSVIVRLLTSLGISTLFIAGAAQATELCVKCTGPDASYACVVGGSSNTNLDTVAKFYCITSLAKAGSHASCSIDRSTTAPCPGQRKELPIPAFLNDSGGGDQPRDTPAAPDKQTEGSAQQATIPPAATPHVPPPGVEPESQPPGQPANEKPPGTVQEMMEKSAKSAGTGINETQKSAGDAAKTAGTALEKVGSAVGGAAKNSWKCLSSFFSNC